MSVTVHYTLMPWDSSPSCSTFLLSASRWQLVRLSHGSRAFSPNAEKLIAETDLSGNVYHAYMWGATGLAQRVDVQPTVPIVIGFTFDPSGNRIGRHPYHDPGGTRLTTDRNLYDAYGQLICLDEYGLADDPNNAGFVKYEPIGYKGQFGCYRDRESGLIYCHHRYYSPGLGRWLSRDPIGLEGGLNVYEFCSNNPVVRTDPSGLQGQRIQTHADNWAELLARLLGISAPTRSSSEIPPPPASARAVPYLGASWSALNNMQDGRISAAIFDLIQFNLLDPGLLYAIPGGEEEAVLGDANFVQKTFGLAFSEKSHLAGQTVESVANALRAGTIRVSDLPIDYIDRGGSRLILNTRSAKALEQAGVPRTFWNAINRTGQADYEIRLTRQLSNNGLTSKGIRNVRPSHKRQ